ncbi:MAG: transposase, partial [Nanoarchaeota archaeon]
HQHNPKATPLYQIVAQYFGEFKRVYPERFQEQYGYWRECADKAVTAFLECGIFEFGFAKVHCKDCGYTMLVPFSCKARCFCPSCQQKRTILWAEWLTEEVLAPVEHRQFVFTIPKILRRYFLRNRSLLGELARCAWLTLKEFFASVYPDITEPITPAAVLCIQTFGNLLSWNSHIHGIIANGCFVGDVFHPLPEIYLTQGLDTLSQLFRAQVITMLRKQNLLSEELARNILNWRHNSGFSVHSSSVIAPGDKQALESLAQYILRNPVSQERIILGKDGTVTYHTKAVNPNFSANFVIFKDPLEFLAEVVQHIPGRTHIVRYFGRYSNVSRGKHEDEEARETLEPMPESRIPRATRQAWARLIAKIYLADPLICPRCGSSMKISKFVQKEEEIQATLDTLGIPYHNSSQPPPAPPLADDYVIIPDMDGDSFHDDENTLFLD